MSSSDVLFNLIVFPYRDCYYEKKYGTVVRDHQMIRALSQSNRVNRIFIINRPISVYEKVLWKHGNCIQSSTKIRQWVRLSLDFIGPLKKRLWTEFCYDKYFSELSGLLSDEENVKYVMLDFTPISKIDYSKFTNCYIWYDLIDNFRLHNRYSSIEKAKVSEKYNCVNRHADLVTGVSEKSLKQITNGEKVVLNNGLLEKADIEGLDEGCYEFGYIGFISDKFDTEFVKRLVNETGYRVVLYGKIQDKNTKKALSKIDNVTLKGEFAGHDIPRIMRTFKIGILPYLIYKSHDESPLKLYEYMNYGKPVIATQQYEKCNEYIYLYNGNESLKLFVERMLNKINEDYLSCAHDVQDNLSSSDYWHYKVEYILDLISSRST